MNQIDCDTVMRVDSNGITTLTLNRPDQFNALSEALLNQLEQMLAEIGEDNSVRVVIMKANGRAFCVGHDLKEMRANTDKVYLHSLFSKAGEVMLRIKHLPQPVIASVHSVAAAGGCQLVAAVIWLLPPKMPNLRYRALNWVCFAQPLRWH